MTFNSQLHSLLERIALALERSHPPLAPGNGMSTDASVYVWQADGRSLASVGHVNALPLELLQGVASQTALLLANTRQFAQGFAANNALLWGARGMGKSSLVKAVHREVTKSGEDLKLIEIHREDLATLPDCLALIRRLPHRVLVFCDDLSFDSDDSSYKSLKAVLEGGVEGRPENMLFYATSNRRHLMPRDMIENELSSAINPSEAVDERVSLSDRFGLWIGFHYCSQGEYLSMVDAYVAYFALEASGHDLHATALAWATTRGARSGRVAWQFVQDLAGRQGKKLTTTV